MENRVKEASANPQITVVTGTLNRPEIVIQLITQLVEVSKKIDLEVIVVDQSLSENFVKLKNQFPVLNNFTLVHFDKPNTCKYLNYGWKNAKAPIVLYLDDDVTITDNSVQSHIDAYTDPTIKAVAGRVINDGEKTTKDGQVGKILWCGAAFTKNFTFEKPTFVDYPYGCNMSFRKQALMELSGFDERFAPPIYAFNEVDMGARISRKWKDSILFQPKALVYHHRYKRGGTRNDFELKEVANSNNFNYGYFIGKNFTLFKNFIFLLRRLPYQIVKEPRSIPQIFKGFLYGKKT